MGISQRFVNAISGFMGKGYDEGQSQTQWRSLGVGANSTISDIAKNMPGMVFPALTVLANGFSMIKLYVEKKKGDDTITETNHPLLTSIKFPHPAFSSNKLLKLWLLSRSVYGEVIWIVYKYKMSIYRIIPVDPRSLSSIDFDEEGTPVSFQFHMKDGGMKKFSADDIVYFTTPNLDDFRRGFAGAKPVIGKIDTLVGAEKYNKKFFDNDATPSLILNFKNTVMTLAQKLVAKADWLSQFRGADNAHKTAVVDGAVSVQTIGTLPKDLAFKDIYTVTEDSIRANWQVNKTLMGLTENINRATIEGAEYNHAKNVLEPIFEEFVSELELKFLPKFHSEADIIIQEIEVKYESPVKEDLLTKAQIGQIGTGASPFMSTNEARQLIGLGTVEGDEYDRVPTQNDTEIVDVTPTKGMRSKKKLLTQGYL